MEELYLNDGRRAYTRTGFAVLLSLVVITALQFLLAMVFSRFLQYEWAFLSLMLLPQYLIAMPVAALLMWKMPTFPLVKKKLNIGQYMIIIMICIAIMYAGNLLGQLVNLIIQAVTQSDMSQPVEDLITSSSVWTNLVFMVILAPIAEELFFRKLLISRLMPFGEKPAILLSALAFGLFHGNFTQFFHAFGLGLAFGYIYIKTGKLIYTVILHILINFLGSIVSVAVLQAGLALLAIYGVVMVCLAIAGTVLFFVNLKRIRMSRGLFGVPKGKGAVFLNPGTILLFVGCAALFVLNTLSMMA